MYPQHIDHVQRSLDSRGFPCVARTSPLVRIAGAGPGAAVGFKDEGFADSRWV